ncbi:MAG: acetyl-CoA C-acyltransferase [Acidobacteriota bacterium]
MDRTVIVSACRTPMGRFMGGLAPITAPRLGAVVVKEAVRRAGIAASDVQEVIMGNVLQAGVGQNPARQAAIFAGLSESVGAVTINKVCGSALKSVMLADQAIRAGDAQVIVAGGMESMSNAPYYLFGARGGFKLGHQRLVDGLIHDGLWDVYSNQHMGDTAEMITDKYAVTREQMDEWAYISHQRAVAAIEGGLFQDEIIGVDVPGAKGAVTAITVDESPRKDTSVEKLAALKPAFKKDGGRVTAGNAPGTNDGASALVVTSESYAKQHGLTVMGVIAAQATAGLSPDMVLMTPEPTIRALWNKTGWRPDQVSLYEINEAFAVQQVALGKVLEIPREKHNARGGAVALGHPIGASGARCLTTLLYALKSGQKGVVSLCLGGGNGVGLAVERV